MANNTPHPTNDKMRLSSLLNASPPPPAPPGPSSPSLPRESQQAAMPSPEVFLPPLEDEEGSFHASKRAQATHILPKAESSHPLQLAPFASPATLQPPTQSSLIAAQTVGMSVRRDESFQTAGDAFDPRSTGSRSGGAGSSSGSDGEEITDTGDNASSGPASSECEACGKLFRTRQGCLRHFETVQCVTFHCSQLVAHFNKVPRGCLFLVDAWHYELHL